jgi:hypothetical protein
LPGETRVGCVLGDRGQKSVAVTELAQRLDRHGEEDLPVEEQDHSWYIAHLGADPRGWIDIEEDSPLYEGFRRCHADWLRKLSEARQGK